MAKKKKIKKPVAWYCFTCDHKPVWKELTTTSQRYHARPHGRRYECVIENPSSDELLLLKLKFSDVVKCPWERFKNVRDYERCYLYK